jgi:glycosyltransferase involved in cell wall biosynthesis
MLVRYYGHVGAASGYGQAANETCMAIREAGIDLEISTDGKQLRHPHLPLSSCIRNEADLTPNPDAIIVHTLPLDCIKLLRKADMATCARLIAYTTWEGTAPISHAVQVALSGFTDVWVPSSVTASWFAAADRTATVVPHAYYTAMGGRSDRPCSRCGDFHVIDRFNVGDRVSSPHGDGVVTEWSQYAGPVHVVIALDDGVRAVVPPCLLRTLGRDTIYRFYYIGAWVSRKNVDGVIRAYLRSFAPTDKVELVIQAAGAGDSACDVARIATGLGIEDMPPVRFSNQRLSDEQIRSLHRQCNCFVTATHGEAWSLPAFDAMLAGNHIIAPRDMGSDHFLMDTSADRYGGVRVPAGGEVWLASDPMAPAGHVSAVYLGTHGLTVRSEWIDPDISMLGKLMRRAYVENKINLRVNYSPAALFGRQAVGARIKSLLEKST